MTCRRYLNLIYFWLVEHADAEEVAKLDAELASLAMAAAPPLPTPIAGRRPGLPSRPPSWWRGPDDATTSNQAAAVALKDLTRLQVRQ